jgi:predicted transcriptional regulator
LRTISEQRLNWRRDKVRELSVKGYTQRRIAEILKISLTLVNEDLQYLRIKSKENISKYIEEYLPAEYENCLDGLNNILTEAWNMTTDTSSDKRERMQALSLAKECYAMKLDLLSSATVLDRAVKFVDRHRNVAQQDNELVINDNNDRTAEPIKNTG